ncbi:MAG: serine/threonine protein kinase [Myxococcales bacterium]|nr:serine/threonine protein kinase [Myxococcales bacterium]
MPARPLLQPLSVVDGKYTLLSHLGEGGMGVVFVAEGPDGARVALKAIGPSKAAEEAERRARFEREISVCRSISHPNLMPILDHGVDGATGSPYLVMPLLVGEDLETTLAREKVLEPGAAVRVVLQACRGLSLLHQGGIVHRDVKPSNLFLERSHEGIVTVRVSDFGLAKLGELSGTLTASGTGMGSPAYMAPEQSTSAKHADARADLWGLAMVLYHALAGRPAFERAGSFFHYVVDSARDVPHVQDNAPWVPPTLARALHAALLRSPDARWPDVSEMALGLEMAVGADVAEANLLVSELVSLSPTTRAQVAPRAVLPSTWHELLRG